MSTATRWYATREAVKGAVPIAGSQADALVDEKIQAATEDVERLVDPRIFIPQTATKYFRWPQLRGRPGILYLDDEDLLAVTQLITGAQDTVPVTIASSDYFLEPAGSPPFKRIEIDQASSSRFSASNPQRAIAVTGRWGCREETVVAGALAEADDGSETELQVTDASLVGVGDTLLIGSEQLFVSGRAFLDTTANLNDTLTAAKADSNVTVDSGALVKQGEVILIEAEEMLVRSITGNNLQVERAVNGTALAAHSSALDVYSSRSLTVVRGVNGSTAATHLIGAAIAKFVVPKDVSEFCVAQAIAHMKQDQSAWSGALISGEGAVAARMVDLFYLRERLKAKYGQLTF